MTSWLESKEAIRAVDDVLAGVGLEHGRRATRIGSWKQGERVRQPKNSAGLETAGGRKAPGVVRIAEWEKFSWLQAGFSTRQGGGSTAYSFGEVAEQNLGWTAEDSAEVMTENRRRFLAAVVGKSQKQVLRSAQDDKSIEKFSSGLVTMRQFHSGMVRILAKPTSQNRDVGHPDWSTAEGKAVLRGDGLMTDESGVLLGVQTADCVPVLIADTKTHAVAAFHAGWRGTLARIVERGIGTMQMEFGSKPKDLVAAIGPAIRPCCFAVGEEVRFDFESQFAYSPKLFTEVYDSDPIREKYPLLFMTARAPGHSNIGPQIHLDLQEANRRQLLDAGLKAKSITVVEECTSCARMKGGRRKYFSHRAESGFTGRMLSVIGTK
jgi:YfiH family protein